MHPSNLFFKLGEALHRKSMAKNQKAVDYEGWRMLHNYALYALIHKSDMPEVHSV